jgi:predicted enzyme related to lactoylglutathione lyase
MKIRNIVPMLATGDMEATVRFYGDAFGFELRDKFESGGQTWWCEMMRDGHAIMFTQHGVNADAPGAREGFAQTSVNLYLDSGIEGLHGRLKQKGYAVSDLRVTFYRMREFHLADPSGYSVLVGQPTNDPPTVVDETTPF